MFIKEDPHAVQNKVNILPDTNYNIVVLLTHADGTTDKIVTFNQVMTTGTNYYAELLDQATPTNTFTSCYLGNPVGDDTIALTDDFSDFTPGAVTGTEKTRTSQGINNLDSGNSGKGAFIYTWKFEWTSGDFNTEAANNIRTAIISIASATGTDPLLNHFNFTIPFQKLSTSTLTLWVNHNLAGAP